MSNKLLKMSWPSSFNT